MSKSTKILTALLFLTFSSFCQIYSIEKRKYERGFSFKEGIYITFQDFKNNNPVPKSRIKTRYNYLFANFFENITQIKKLEYYDTNDSLHKTTWKKVWGYSNGLNIYHNKMRIDIIGAICHLVFFYQTSYQVRTPSGYASIPAGERAKIYIIDFKDGAMYKLNKKNLKLILMRDKELHEKFVASTKTEKMNLYHWMKLFNEYHPIYFPVD